MRCLRRIQGHRAPTTPKLVEGEGAIASRRGVAKLCSLAKATILWQGKLGRGKPAKLGMAYWFATNKL